MLHKHFPGCNFLGRAFPSRTGARRPGGNRLGSISAKLYPGFPEFSCLFWLTASLPAVGLCRAIVRRCRRGKGACECRKQRWMAKVINCCSGPSGEEKNNSKWKRGDYRREIKVGAPIKLKRNSRETCVLVESQVFGLVCVCMCASLPCGPDFTEEDLNCEPLH